ncbi:MAG: CRTAC1 family protein [Bryobacteraceae bacterium]
MKRVAIAAAVVAALTAASGPERWFADVTQDSGIAFKHTNRAFDNEYAHIMAGYTALGAAAAVADYDSDGFDDLLLTDSSATGRNRLFRNNGRKNGSFGFTDVSDKVALPTGNDENNATADAMWFDYNNDGAPDLFIPRFGHSLLLANRNGKFQDVTKAAGLGVYANAITSIAFDYDCDGDLDLLVGSYFQPINIFKPGTPRFFPESFETANNGGGLTLYRNNNDGTFTDVTEKAGLRQSGWVLDLGHADADNDGDEDLYAAADFGTDRIYRNNGDGTFTDITEATIGLDTKKGMNVDWGDYDNDGLLDIYVTNITDEYMREGNFLWRNTGDLKFSDVARETGAHDTGWGWGAKFFDVDNDTWLDLYVMNGWVSAGKESYVPDVFQMITRPNVDFADARSWPPMGSKSLSGYQKKRLFHNERGQIFKDVAPRHGLDSVRDGRGIAVADFDNDGRLDIVTANANGEPYVYRNQSPNGNRWIQFHLKSTDGNRAAIGAQVRLTAAGKTYLRYISGGNSFAGQSTNRVHFGLGTAGTIDSVEVRWPCGKRETYSGLAPGKLHELVEGKGKQNR